MHRNIGSLGATSHMSKIIKGTIGAGQMGNEQVTVHEPGRGPGGHRAGHHRRARAIPGPKGGVVFLRNSVKKFFEPKGAAGVSVNPQKASGRNPQKASAATSKERRV